MLKDGYYLAVYAVIDELSCMLQVPLRHDQNMSLWKKKGKGVKLIHVWEFERITRRKHHDAAFPNTKSAKAFIETCLKEYDLKLSDMQEIFGTPYLDTTQDYDTYQEYPAYAFHSIAHLFSALFLDSTVFYQEQTIGLAVDGGADFLLQYQYKRHPAKYHFIGCVVKKGTIELFPILSPGILWELASCRYHMEEGSMMALASAVTGIVLPQEVPDFDLNMANDADAVDCYLEQLEKVVKSAADRDSTDSNFDKRFSHRENVIGMIMQEVQKLSAKIMEHNIETIVNAYHLNTTQCHLAIGGGFGLNCPVNSYLMEKYQFQSLLAPPCMNDSGQSMGMALYYFYKHTDAFSFLLQHAFYGNAVGDVKSEILEYQDYIKKVSDYNAEEAAEDVQREVVAWMNGRAEIGPRALGGRSLLGDSRRLLVKEQLNAIKKRQWWRPVAPVLPVGEAKLWFQNASESPYMLRTFYLKDEARCSIPSVCHIDGSARIQTITQENQSLYQLIERFAKKTKVSVLCNTSLNDKGEPIIDTVADCIHFALQKGIGIVYVDGLRIELKGHSQYLGRNSKEPFRFHSLFSCPEEGNENLKEYSKEYIFYVIHAKLNQDFDFYNEKDRKAVRAICEKELLRHRKLVNDCAYWMGVLHCKPISE